MNCKLFEQHYLDELDGSLDASLSAALHAHKDECAACQTLYEEAREGLQMTRRYMVVHEPSPALDDRIMAAAREALAKQSASKELDNLSSTKGFFGWLNTLLASPSFRPALAFCAVAVLVGSVYMYQSQHQGDLFAPNKTSQSGINIVRDIPADEKSPRRLAPARSASKRQEIAKSGTAAKGTTGSPARMPAAQPVAAAKPTAKDKNDTGPESLRKTPSPSATLALKAPRQPRLRPIPRRAAPRRRRRYRRMRRSRRSRGRRRYRLRYHRKARRRPKATRRLRRRAPQPSGDQLSRGAMQDAPTPGTNKREKSRKAKKKRYKAARPPKAAKPSPRSDDMAAPRKAAASKEGDLYKSNSFGGARGGQPRFATPPPPIRRRTPSAPGVAMRPPPPPAPSAPSPRRMAPQSARKGMRRAAGKAAGMTDATLGGGLGRNQSSYTSLVNAAALSAQRGNARQATSQYRQALSYANSRQRAHVYMQLGIIHVQRNDLRSARLYFARAVQYTPKKQRRQVRERIYKIYRMRGKYQNAIKMLQRLKQLYPNRQRSYDRELRRLRNP